FRGGSRWKSEYPWCIIERSNISQKFSKKSRKTKKKSDGKSGILRKTSFRPNRFFYMDVTQKLINN
ncbi:Uncharacterized protein FWK35_00001020, partial [Aphis craccivora]